MSKSVYSFVLMDNLVEAVDRLAYMKNTSRSNMVNQILAEYLSLVTPEKRHQDIFVRIEEMMSSNGDLQITVSPSDCVMSIKSALSYKYNPTVRYSLVLYHNLQNTFGELRVFFRTQNQELLNVLTEFFMTWAKVESTFVSHRFPNRKISHQIKPGKLVRQLLIPQNVKNISDEQLGEAAARYIQLFDRVMKLYFTHRHDPSYAIKSITKEYQNYLGKEELLI